MRVRTHDSPRLHRLKLLVLVGIAALAIPAVAGAWAQYYAVTQWFGPGGVETSGSNYDINYNYTAFTSQVGTDFMGLNLCPTTGGCYPYKDCYNDCSDPRTISYGYAKCTAYLYNTYSINVNSCYVRNIYG